MCPDFRRGAEAIAKAQERDGGNFRRFTPSIFWKNDQEEKYLLFLNDINSIPTVEMINYIPQQGKKKDGDTFEYFEQVIARTEPGIGEASDPMVEKWDGNPKKTCVAVAVELEPTFEEVKGRKRPTGFAVKTKEFDRRIRDDEGELTDETETVEAPEIGFISQSPFNFFNVITSYDNNDAPIESTALKITRVGSGNSTTYTVGGFPDQEIDLSGLVDCVDGISYLGDELDAVLEEVQDIEDDFDVAAYIGSVLLEKRLEELADRERYDEIFKSITKSLDKWKGKKDGDKEDRPKRERPARRSQRRKSEDAAEAVSEPEAESAPETEPEEAPVEKKEPAKRSRAKAKTEEKSESKPAGNARLAELRKRAAERAAA